MKMNETKATFLRRTKSHDVHHNSGNTINVSSSADNSSCQLHETPKVPSRRPRIRERITCFYPSLFFFGLCCGFYIVDERQVISANSSHVLKQMTAALVRDDQPGKRQRDADGCYHVFIDAGANIGVHGRFLLEPEKYPGARIAKIIFDREFGEARDNRDFCVFEIEPNPNHHETLRQKSEAYKAMGWRYHLMPVGASDKEGFLEFNHQHDNRYEEWGFSVKNLSARNSVDKVQIPVIRLASWIEEHVNNRQIPSTTHKDYSDVTGGPKVVMKIDIEACEYVVLPDLMLSGAMCGIDFIFGEFHPNFAPLEFPGQNVPLETETQLRAFGDALQQMIPASRNCKTRFEYADDESYLHDGIPLPIPSNNTDF